MNIYFKKIILSVFALIIVFLSLITPSKVYALDLDDPFNMLNQAWSTAIEPALSKAGAVAWRNAINLYLGKIARESAEWVATGGKGQKPTFITNPGDYLTNVGDE